MLSYVIVPVVRAFLSPFQGRDHVVSVHRLTHEPKSLRCKVDTPESMGIRQSVLSNRIKIRDSSAQFPVRLFHLFQAACKIDESFGQFAHQKRAYFHSQAQG